MSEGQHSPEEVRTLLFRAAQVMVPRFRYDPDGDERPHSPQQKLTVLEEHMLTIARWRAVLEEARLYMLAGTKDLEDKWEHLEGWQTARRKGERTQASVVDAKRQVRPDLYNGIRDGKWLATRLSEQIKRLERDEDVVSRSYTFISGG